MPSYTTQQPSGYSSFETGPQVPQQKHQYKALWITLVAVATGLSVVSVFPLPRITSSLWVSTTATTQPVVQTAPLSVSTRPYPDAPYRSVPAGPSRNAAGGAMYASMPSELDSTRFTQGGTPAPSGTWLFVGIAAVLGGVIGAFMGRSPKVAMMAVAGEEKEIDPEKVDKNVKIMKAFAEQYLKRTDTRLCVDKGVAAVVLKGLAVHKEELGAPLCPCRNYEDKQAEANQGYWNCPCVPMRERKECHCMLFLTPDNDFAGDEQTITVEEIDEYTKGMGAF